MFSLMGNCWSARKGRVQRELTLAILGLDNAGKTVTANILQGDPLQTAPTIGFQKSELTFDKYSLTLFDLGGGKNIRGIWTKYLAEIYGIVYMVDSSDIQRIEESTYVFKQLLENPKVKGKPILLLANKQDKEGALDEMDICEQMRLEEVVNSNRCPCRVEMCAATKGTGRKKDPKIKEGLLWLCDMINLDYERLHNRVQEDLKIRDQERKKDMEETRARVKLLREEREKAEEEERLKTGATERPTTPEGHMEGDPFKRLDVDEIKKKEATLKAQKKKKKKDASWDKNENRSLSVSNSLSNGNVSSNNKDEKDDDDDDIIITSPSPRHSKLTAQFNSNNKHTVHPVESTEVNSFPHPLDHATSNGTDLRSHINGSARHLDPLDEKKPQRKRRKKIKKNKLAPLDGGLDTADTPRPLDSPSNLPWNNVRPRSKLSATGEPGLETTLETEDTDNSERLKWALVEDLTEPTQVDYFPPNRQPNFESEDIVT